MPTHLAHYHRLERVLHSRVHPPPQHIPVRVPLCDRRTCGVEARGWGVDAQQWAVGGQNFWGSDGVELLVDPDKPKVNEPIKPWGGGGVTLK